MSMDITLIDLLGQKVSSANVRSRCSWISISIDLFDQNVGMAYANVRHRCS